MAVTNSHSHKRSSSSPSPSSSSSDHHRHHHGHHQHHPTTVEGGEHKMEAILARRVHDVEAADEYLIKWANEPYSRVSWHSMDVLVNQDGGAAMRVGRGRGRQMAAHYHL